MVAGGRKVVEFSQLFVGNSRSSHRKVVVFALSHYEMVEAAELRVDNYSKYRFYS